MSQDAYTYQKAIDQARTSEQADRAMVAIQNAVEYIVPPVAMELGVTLMLAVLAVFALASRRGYLPEWARFLFGAKRTLHRRRELRPKRSPFLEYPPEGTGAGGDAHASDLSMRRTLPDTHMAR